MISVAVGLREKTERPRHLAVVVVEADDVADIVDPVEMVEIGMLNRVINQTAWIKRAVLPPGKRLDTDHLGRRFDLLDAGSRITEHVGTGDGCGLVSCKIKDVAGWPETNDIGGEHLTVGLVLRRVVGGIGRGRPHDLGDIEIPAFACERMEPVDLVVVLGISQPGWETEMPQGDDWFDAGLLKLPTHGDIVGKGRLVVLPRLRLNARPLDAEAIMGDSNFLQSFQILVKVAPRVESMTYHRCPFLFHQQIPIPQEIVRISRLLRSILILQAACGNTPGKSFIAGQFFRLMARSFVEWSERMDGTSCDQKW